MARLLDCFGALVNLGAQLGADLDAGRISSDMPPPHARVLEAIEAARRKAERLGVGADSIESASFAMTAWIDEMVARHPAWAGEPTLQARLFNSGNAASEFFHHLASLRPEQGELREIYWLVLVFGFKGQYHFEQDDQGELGKLKTLHAQQLPVAPLAIGRLARERITPRSFETQLLQGRRKRTPERRERALLRTACALAVLVPLLYWTSHLLKAAPSLAHRPIGPHGWLLEPTARGIRQAVEVAQRGRRASPQAASVDARPARVVA